mmetsp:Transcript_45957/g.147726  ORF Transcript_45957/g.147726 Transcript_45957/m.147726 type:complete len:228 (+) Transcript_45957:239-922(+)
MRITRGEVRTEHVQLSENRVMTSLCSHMSWRPVSNSFSTNVCTTNAESFQCCSIAHASSSMDRLHTVLLHDASPQVCSSCCKRSNGECSVLNMAHTGPKTWTTMPPPPRSDAAFSSARRCTNRSTVEASLSKAAQCKGCVPALSRDDTELRRASNNSSTCSWPDNAAQCMAWAPFLSPNLSGAPASNKKRTNSTSPRSAAINKACFPSRSRRCKSAPAPASTRTTAK